MGRSSSCRMRILQRCEAIWSRGSKGQTRCHVIAWGLERECMAADTSGDASWKSPLYRRSCSRCESVRCSPFTGKTSPADSEKPTARIFCSSSPRLRILSHAARMCPWQGPLWLGSRRRVVAALRALRRGPEISLAMSESAGALLARSGAHAAQLATKAWSAM